MDTINLNESVKVKLTDFGISLYKLRYNNDPEKDEQGYTSFQLWTLMNIYGPYIGMAKDSPFDLDILLKDNKYFNCKVTSKNGSKINMIFYDKESHEKLLYSDSTFLSDKDGRVIKKEEILTIIPTKEW